MIKAILGNMIAKSGIERKVGELDRELIYEIKAELEAELDIIAVKMGSLDKEQFKKDIVPLLISCLSRELEMEIAGNKPVPDDIKELYKKMIIAKANETVYI